MPKLSRTKSLREKKEAKIPFLGLDLGFGSPHTQLPYILVGLSYGGGRSHFSEQDSGVLFKF